MYAAMQSVHTPLEVPQVTHYFFSIYILHSFLGLVSFLKDYADMYPDITDSNRKTYLGMVTAMDDVLKNLVEELKSQDMYENSIIIFSSDNGGDSNIGGASNEPLRNMKGSVYEGGIRVPAFVHSPRYVKQPG